MIKRNFLFVFLILSLLWTSCNTEFSLNGEYRITPVVVGLIDHTKNVHIIKITKAFMGDGDNLVYAANPDSNYFNTVEAQIIEFKNGTETGRVWTLHDSIITGKDTTGIFYAPEQKVYVFYESNLDSTATYKLIADLNEGAHKIEGGTALIPRFRVTTNFTSPGYKIPFAANTVASDQDYKPWQITVQEGDNAKRYTYKYTMRWTEFYTNGTNQSFSATRNNGDKYQANPAAPAVQNVTFMGVDFYRWVADVVPDDPNVIRRKIDGIDLKISVAHYELDQYMNVSKPVTSIAQVKPEYTNIIGGYGIFSSRVVYEYNNFRLNESSMKELCRGQYTATKLFCSHFPEDAAQNYYCP